MHRANVFGRAVGLALLVLAASTAHPHASVRPDADGDARVYLPLAARDQDVLDRPVVPTATATRTPTVAPTPAPSPTPTVFTCPALETRLQIREIDVYPLEVKVKRGRYEGTSPIFIAPDAVGDGSHVAWSDTDGGIHVTALDYYDLPAGARFDLEGDEVRGLVVHEDGVALLVVRGDSLFLVRLDADGQVRFETRLVGGGAQDVAGNKWVDNWGHEARLVWADGRYAVYSGHTQQFGSRGKHQGDLLWHFDADGKQLDGRDGWDWGCSHSLDLRLAHNGERLGAVCLSDAYPTKGFHFHHREKEIRREPSGDGAGYSAANLGGWVPLADGFLMSFTSPEGRASADVGLIRVGNDASIGPVTWVTDSATVEESAPHLARFGKGYLAGWTADARHVVAVLDEALDVVEGPVALDAPMAARDDMVPFPTGDVVWAHAWDEYSTLKIVRVQACSAD